MKYRGKKGEQQRAAYRGERQIVRSGERRKSKAERAKQREKMEEDEVKREKTVESENADRGCEQRRERERGTERVKE